MTTAIDCDELPDYEHCLSIADCCLNPSYVAEGAALPGKCFLKSKFGFDRVMRGSDRDTHRACLATGGNAR